ncbi:hypothetical protein Salat_2354700 [Sesamum alatum]|uniref:Uncharacterized protein n=1 Tax=Sesamum alatum TaxID=300844 RepID=A0AAE2CER2_9LAMI|nr:hypothetical protein Salat_2354700 [Sesamum alatum]
MEATFVGALVEHKKHGNFKRNGINFHAVMSAIYDVGRYVIADDAIWKKFTKKRVLAKCYVNAYEDFYEGLCMLYGPNSANDEPTVFHEEEEVDSLDTTYVDSTSLLRFLDEYYASDDEDKVNSILALPAAPPPSPDPSYVSVEHTSSSVSNEISKSH